MKGKVCIVTGANTGIGKVTAMELARLGAEVALLCRSEERTRPVVEEIKQATGNENVWFAPLDLGSLDSVRSAAKSWLDTDKPIHVLVNNAGLAGQRGLTKEGFELQFGVNHLGHFLLTNLLLEHLKESAPSRIVNVASRAHYRAKSGIDYDAVRMSTPTVSGFPEYQVSKLANVLFTMELAKRIEGTGVTTYALHPGVVASDVWRRVPWPFRSIMKMFMISNEEGAKTTLHCAISDAVANENGLYYDECKVQSPSRIATEEAAAELWRRSEKWVAA